MATAIQFRRGTTAQHANFTGLVGEITVDTDLSTIRVHDGSTAGGTRIAKYSEIVALGTGDITAVNTVAGSGLTGGSATGNVDLAINYESLTGNLVPSSNNVYSLGSVTNYWKDAFIGPGSLYINGQKVIEDNSGTIQFTADAGQNMSLLTSGGGDIELNAGTADIQMKSNVVFAAGKTFSATGGLTLTSNLNVNSQYINNLSDPAAAQDAATKNYVDTTASIVRVTGDQSIAGNKTFSNNIVVSGNLTVSGTTTTVNSETISLADNIIDLNSNFTSGAPTEDAGIKIKRGDSADVQIKWNETSDVWQFTNDGSTYQSMLTDSTARALVSATDAGGDGSFAYNSGTGVFTYTGPSASEVRAHFSAGTGITITSGTIATTITQYADSDVDTHLNTGTATSGQLMSWDGSDYDWIDTPATYGDSDARSAISATDAGGDGSFTYNDSTGVFTYTGPSAAEVRAHFSASGDLSYNSSTGVFSFTNDAGDIEGVTAGDGLTGGGTSGTVTINAVGGYGISVNADNIEVSNSDVRSLFSASGDLSYNSGTGVISFTERTDAEVRGLVSASGDLSYNSSTGAFSFTERTDAEVRGLVSATDAGGDGSFSYNSSTGAFTYTGPSASEVRAHFSAGTGVTLSSGQISIGQAVGTASNVTFNDITVSGNLTVSGTTTTVNTETVNIADNQIVLNSNYTGTSPTENGGIEIERGTQPNKTFVWDETADKWTVGSETMVAGTFEGALTGNVTGDVSGNAGTATKWATGRTITLTGDVTGVSGSFDGSGNLSFATAIGAGAIVNADINASAAIADTKLATISTAGKVSNSATTATNANTASAIVARDASGNFSAGTITAALTGNVTGDVSGNAGTATQLATTRTIALTGDVTGSATFDGSANASITATIAANSVALGTDTTGNYVGTITAGTGLSSSGATSGEGIAHSLSITNTGVTAATYGTSSTLPAIAVNAQGQITSASNVNIDHDALTNFVANEHIDHSSVTITAGSGLTGGGTIAATRTINVGAGTGITVNADDVAVNATYIKGLVSATDAGGDGSFAYDSATGVFTYTGPSQAEANVRIDARVSGGTGITYTSGVIALDGTGTIGAGTYGSGASAAKIALITVDEYGRVTAITTGTTGDITGVTAGTYLTGGGTTGTVTLNVDATTTATASKVVARDASGDIYANLFQGTATAARYADLAERYEADAILEAGTVVCFGGEKEVTACDHENDHRVAGVISTDPAYMMNSAAGNNDTHPYVALTGRVPVKVVGPVAKGDLMVASSVKGHAKADNNAKAGTIIGKAIGSIDSGEGVIEVLVNMM